GALTHHIGKIHQVGLFKLTRGSDGTLNRARTPMVQLMRDAANAGEARVGALEAIRLPTHTAKEEEQGPPIGELFAEWLGDEPTDPSVLRSRPGGNGNGHSNGNGNGNGNGHGTATIARKADPAPGAAAEPSVGSSRLSQEPAENIEISDEKSTDRYGIVVFSHLRWGFVWQRPQQFLSRFAKKHPVLFVEEPFFDSAEGKEPELKCHRVMPNV